MAYRSFSFIPAFDNNLLSDRFMQMDNLFSRLTGEKPLTDSPVYNLLQKNKEYYEMIISIPGYKQDELDISIINNQLNITGKPKFNVINDENEENKGIRWIHQGIKKHEFSLSFNLEHRIIIKKAYLEYGLLTLQFIYDIPEQEKPKKINISTLIMNLNVY
jgi:molecular chaperone IbpA